MGRGTSESEALKALQAQQGAPAPNGELNAKISAAELEVILGLKAGSIGAIAWVVMQEQARGVERKDVAKSLGVTEDDLAALVDGATGLSGDESIALWGKGIVALKTAAILNDHDIGRGWDAVEAMAIDKLSNGLKSMRGNGNPMDMLAIAAAANKAVRRYNGEATGMGQRPRAGINESLGAGGISLELQSGELGTIRLNLSPRIQQQLNDQSRVIEAVANRQSDGTGAPGTRLKDLEMLGLQETRKIADGKPILESDLLPKGPIDQLSDFFDEMLEKQRG